MNEIDDLDISQARIKLVKRYFTAFSANNIDDAINCIHPDAIWHVDGSVVVKTVGIIKGHTLIKQWIGDFSKHFRPLNFKVAKLIYAEDDVIAIGRFRHLVLKTNTIVDSDFIIKFSFQDNKIIRYQIFEDSFLLFNAHQGFSSNSVCINKVHYEWDDVGHGPAVIFLHGLFLDRTLWSDIIKELPQNRSIAFDMPGHAKSGWRDGLNLQGIADDIVIWMQEYAVEKATLVGHSQGAMIAMLIASKYPELVENLILVNTSARHEFPERISIWEQRKQVLGLEKSKRIKFFKEIQKNKYSLCWLQNNKIQVEIEINKMMEHDPEKLIKALDAAVLERSDMREAVLKIQNNVVVLSGDLDQATPSFLGQEIADIIPNARHILVDQAAHSIPVESPDVVIKAVKELLRF